MKTKFGNCKLNKDGYYVITSRGEGNKNKFLHRLIFKSFYGDIPNGYIVHHKNGNKTDNCILNLQLMKESNHKSIHHKNKKVSEETRQKLREINKGKIIDEKTKIKMSQSKNSSGYYRVYKQFNKKYKQGFIYVYRYFENGKRKIISSINIDKLEKKVLSKNLPFFKLTFERCLND